MKKLCEQLSSSVPSLNMLSDDGNGPQTPGGGMEALKISSDVLFILLGAILVLAMHAGFAFLELGTVRAKMSTLAGSTGVLAARDWPRGRLLPPELVVLNQ